MPNEGTVVAKERPAVEGLSDPVCIRIRDMRYGYYEPRQIDFANEPGGCTWSCIFQIWLAWISRDSHSC